MFIILSSTGLCCGLQSPYLVLIVFSLLVTSVIVALSYQLDKYICGVFCCGNHHDMRKTLIPASFSESLCPCLCDEVRELTELRWEVVKHGITE